MAENLREEAAAAIAAVIPCRGEYFVARPRPPYVEKLDCGKQQERLRQIRFITSRVPCLRSRNGPVLWPFIALLAMISRLFVLPFSLKAERDQIRAREAADELESLKNRLKDDPVRRTHAIRGFYKRHGITPARNLLALAFLPVMAVALLAVQELPRRRMGPSFGLPASLIAICGSFCRLSSEVADHALRRSCLCNQREAQGPDLDRHPAADDGHRYAVQCRRRHLSDRQRCAAC